MGNIHRPIGVPLRARITFLVIDRGTLHASQHSLQLERKTGSIEIPCAQSTVLLLEPGVTVTHAAVKMCSDQGTLLIWVGEACVRVYSAGEPGGAAGERILAQARLRLNRRSRIAVARRFYHRMLGKMPHRANDIEKLRGMEGAWVRQKYRDLAEEHGVVWTSRDEASHALQEGLAYATATLYGLSEAVILGAGYSPSIGFIHSGDRRSLVYDLADTVKFRTVVPAAFSVVVSGPKDVRSEVRRACRDLFRSESTIESLFDNLAYALE